MEYFLKMKTTRTICEIMDFIETLDELRCIFLELQCGLHPAAKRNSIYMKKLLLKTIEKGGARY